MLTLLALGFLAAGPAIALAALDGEERNATVTQARYRYSTKSHQDYYAVSYEYSVGGTRYEGHRTFSAADATLPPVRAMAVGTTVRVLDFGVGALRDSELVLPGASPIANVAARAAIFAIAGVCTAFVVGCGHYLTWYASWRRRRLYRDGRVATGRVTAKLGAGVGKSREAYRVAYEFTTDAGVTVRATTVTDRASFDATPPQSSVTVFYEPKDPRQGVVYELGGYVFASGVGAAGLAARR